ncbi:MAG: hypothetical protein JWO43_612 [Candidatus Adlerbacteria bacterium]|nr:hypothetical protein [Candidatus Adlerbacteria bacterium]
MKFKTYLACLCVFGILAALGFFLANKPVAPSMVKNTEIIATTSQQDCWNGHLASSNSYGLSISQQRDCALLALASADPNSVKVTATKVGDVPLATIKKMATEYGYVRDTAGDYKSTPLTTTLKECVDSEQSNAGQYSCLLDTEESLQIIIRSLVVGLIQSEKEVARIQYDSNPEYYADTAKQYWEDWYVASIQTDNQKTAACNIAGLDAFGGSIEPQVVSNCFIQHNAADILWLIDQKKQLEESTAQKIKEQR